MNYSDQTEFLKKLYHNFVDGKIHISSTVCSSQEKEWKFLSFLLINWSEDSQKKQSAFLLCILGNKEENEQRETGLLL